MQEEVENRAVTLVISTTKLSGRVLKAAIDKYLAHQRERKVTGQCKPKGKQSVKKLIGQNAGVVNVEVSDTDIKGFDKVARKYGVDYAIRKDTSGEVPKYLVFFKARDADALTAAFNEYTNKKQRNQDKPSVIQRLRSFNLPERIPDKVRVRNKEKGLDL